MLLTGSASNACVVEILKLEHELRHIRNQTLIVWLGQTTIVCVCVCVAHIPPNCCIEWKWIQTDRYVFSPKRNMHKAALEYFSECVRLAKGVEGVGIPNLPIKTNATHYLAMCWMARTTWAAQSIKTDFVGIDSGGSDIGRGKYCCIENSKMDGLHM